MIRRVLLANRGEIALRVLRSLKALGKEGVAVYSDADAESLAVRSADDRFHLGPAPAQDSYLNLDRLLEAAAATGCDAVHPGYGFLSENPAFADAVRGAGLRFLGPSSQALRLMGDKDQARQAMIAAGVPVLPGASGEAIAADLHGAAAEVGYPLLIKAAAGGGGKGMRVVEAAEDLEAALAAVQREARSAFGSDAVLFERWLPAARHVEVQILADQHGRTLALYDRDCSTQRRHQKVLEEAPAPKLSPTLRERLERAAIAAAEAVAYEGAGTVEFLVAGEEAFFLEMNTRLQVEHPVTESITGWDLVAWQVRIAEGEALPERPPVHGHAVEVRLYAEDPEAGYLPSIGTVTGLRWPEGPGVRIDSGIAVGSEITPYYDPMLAKIIAWGPDRPAAFLRLQQALATCALEGVKSNLALLRRLVASPALQAGPVSTRWLEGPGLEALAPQPPDDLSLQAAALAVAERRANALADAPNAFGRLTGFRLGAGRSLTVTLGGEDAIHQRRVALPERATAHRIVHWHGPTLLSVVHGGQTWRFEDLSEAQAAPAQKAGGDGMLTAPMPGLVTACPLDVGQAVEAGAVLLILEAMKMEHTLRAPFPARVAQLNCAVGDQVTEGTTLVMLEPLDEKDAP